MTWEEEADRMVRDLGPVPSRIAAAMREVPRHRFVPASLRAVAYQDEPLPLGRGAPTISAPHMVALQLEWAELAPGLHVLEVGSGSGYLLALLSELVRPDGRAVGAELDSSLAHRSESVLRELGYGHAIEVHATDGADGWPPAAPYDRILVSAATPEIRPAWREQLAVPGICTAPVGSRYEQVFTRLWRTPEGDRLEEGPACRFVELVSPLPRHI